MENMQKEQYISTSPEPLSIEETKKILEQMQSCVCKIYNGEKRTGTGFFIKIPYKSNLLSVLITAYHIINENDKNKNITIALNDDQDIKFFIIDNERKIYTNKKLDVTIIEIKEKDEIKNYLELDDNIKNNIKLDNEVFSNVLKNIYSNKSIYCINYPNGKKVAVSYGQSPQFYEKNIEHKCITQNGSSGAPILLIENQKVIGIHLSSSFLNVNIGSLIIYSIIEFQQIENNIFNNNTTAIYIEQYNNIRMLNKNKSAKNAISPLNINKMNDNFNINNFCQNNKNNMNINPQENKNIQINKSNNPKIAIKINKNKQIKAIKSNQNKIINQITINNQNQINWNNQNQINMNNQNQINMNNQNQNQINFNNQNLINLNNQNQINMNNQNLININNQNQNNINNKALNNLLNNFSSNLIYLFPKKGLNNIGHTHINSTLQCLLHVSELTVYFLNRYPKDKNNLNKKNKSIESHGQISNAFYELVREVCEDELKSKNANFISERTFSPKNFKRILSNCNSQFKNFDINNTKDLTLYLIKTIHEELNYFGDKPSSNLPMPNQYNHTFMSFLNSYNSHNCSIISNLFFGTYEDKILCKKCNLALYNFHKFEFVSFKTLYYKNKIFNIYNGFEDNSKPQQLKGENIFYCNNCKNFENAELTIKIIQPPNKLLINIDYGKNLAFKPSNFKFDEIIDITKYINFDFGAPIKYTIIGVCTYLGFSGSYGQYVAFCKHRETEEWYNFNGSTCKICNKNDIYIGSPYLLLYEKI